MSERNQQIAVKKRKIETKTSTMRLKLPASGWHRTQHHDARLSLVGLSRAKKNLTNGEKL